MKHLFVAKPLPVLQTARDGKTIGDITDDRDSVADAEYEPAAMYTQTPEGTQLTPQFSGVPTTLQPDVPDAYAAVRPGDTYGQRA